MCVSVHLCVCVWLCVLERERGKRAKEQERREMKIAMFVSMVSRQAMILFLANAKIDLLAFVVKEPFYCNYFIYHFLI